MKDINLVMAVKSLALLHKKLYAINELGLGSLNQLNTFFVSKYAEIACEESTKKSIKELIEELKLLEESEEWDYKASILIKIALLAEPILPDLTFKDIPEDFFYRAILVEDGDKVISRIKAGTYPELKAPSSTEEVLTLIDWKIILTKTLTSCDADIETLNSFIIDLAYYLLIAAVVERMHPEYTSELIMPLSYSSLKEFYNDFYTLNKYYLLKNVQEYLAGKTIIEVQHVGNMLTLQAFEATDKRILEHRDTLGATFKYIEECLSSIFNNYSKMFPDIEMLEINSIRNLPYSIRHLIESNFSKLSSLRLFRCYIEGSLFSLVKMNSIEEFEAVRCNFTKIVTDEYNSKLKTFKITNQDTFDLSTLKDLKHLERLEVGVEDLTDLSNLSESSFLKELTLSYLHHSTLEQLPKYDNLEKLSVSGSFNSLTLSHTYPRVTNLTVIDFIGDILDSLDKFPSLEHLSIMGGRVEEFPDMTELKHLKTLSISNVTLGKSLIEINLPENCEINLSKNLLLVEYKDGVALTSKDSFKDR